MESTSSSINDEPIRVRDKVPLKLWLAMGAGMTERAAHYGSIVMIQNYVQNRYDDKSRPGVLGLGQEKATQIQFAFSLINSLTPIVGALLADSKWGRYWTILYAFPIYLAGLAVLCAVSVNGAVAHKAGLGTLLVCLTLMAIGSGGIRVNMNAFIGDQYTMDSPGAFRDRRGRSVKPDHDLTLQHIYSSYYWMINIGSLAGIVTTLLEARVSFGVAFLVPLVFIALGLAILVAFSKTFVRHGPTNGNLTRTVAYVRHHVRVRLGRSQARGNSQGPGYDEQFSQFMTDTWKACRIFSTFTIAWLCWGQAENNFISQAGSMNTTGIPNDMLYFLNPIVLVIFIPCFEKGVYPFLRARGAKLTPVTRIFIGYIILTVSMIYIAGLQAIIYSRGPCYSHPRACPASQNGALPNDISAFAQIPVYVLQSIAEIFSQIAATEYAYSKAPDSMKSVMQAIAQSFGSIASLLGVAIAPASRDPWLVIVYGSLAGAMAVTSVVFWYFFARKGDAETSSGTVIDSTPIIAPDSEKEGGRVVTEGS
ncbi:oligopeptide transporter [Dactylonectria macrodidyma]|uniref:Oligopeptide transporter n=1 Tax=Dactylonectria macrodidyma TaxID=307937 RepID=A0A9P9D2I5_9HYPO|nr:oligopeptide transporter [Dactylonectria macrodidyma]